MESSCFQNQLLSVMEVLAQAAVAEINRRVDDSCAVLRLELSQSRKDIELLKSKCEVMEAELRKRRRRRGCNTPAEEDSSFKDLNSPVWDRQTEDESPNKRQQCEVTKLAYEADNIPIKEEHEEEETWRNNPHGKQISGAEQLPCFSATESTQTENFLETYCAASDPESQVSPADGGSTFSEQQLSRNLNEAELVMKHKVEEEPSENAAPLGSVHAFVTEEAEAPLWSSSLSREDGDVRISNEGQLTQQFSPVFASQTSLHYEFMEPKTHCVGKSHSVLLSAARAKRRARTFGCRKPQTDEGQNVFKSMNLDPQQSQHQCREETHHTGCDATITNPTASLCWQSRSNFGLMRRTRTPWRSGLGEKRFSCTYCDKNFMRFSQLKEHLRSHTGEKPFTCAQCGRSFTKQCNLIRHAVVHSGEKPYECSLCGKCFTQRSSLKSHQKTTH